LVGLALFGIVTLQEKSGVPRPANSASDLPRMTLAQALARDAGDLDRIVMQDGKAGWFLIEDVAMALAQDIGMYGQRLGFALLGASRHVPLYCGGDDAILWGVRQDQISGALAFCNAERLDLSALRPLARAVTMHAGYVEAEVLPAFDARISAMVDAKTAVWISRPHHDAPHAFQRRIITPMIWPDPADEAQMADYNALDAKIQAEVERHLAAFPLGWRLSLRRDYPPSLTVFSPPPDNTAVATGTALKDAAGHAVILPEESWAERRILVFDCDSAACAALDDLNLADMFTPLRDPARLTELMAQAIPLGQSRDDLSTLAEWQETHLTRGKTAPIRLPYRYVTLR
jgi:hypothetical protein